jgi:hypothetical protein
MRSNTLGTKPIAVVHVWAVFLIASAGTLLFCYVYLQPFYSRLVNDVRALAMPFIFWNSVILKTTPTLALTPLFLSQTRTSTHSRSLAFFLFRILSRSIPFSKFLFVGNIWGQWLVQRL